MTTPITHQAESQSQTNKKPDPVGAQLAPHSASADDSSLGHVNMIFSET